MYYRLDNSDDRAKLGSRCETWITEASSEHNKMHEEWDEADRYFEGDQAPPGFTEAHTQQLANANDPTVPNADADVKQYIVFPKIMPAHEGIFGEFIDGKKMLTARGRSPHDTKIAKVIKLDLEYIQDKINMWDESIVPMIDSGIRRGIDWVKVGYDPARDLPLGRITVDEISCRDVLLDPQSRSFYYQDTRYRIHRKRYSLDEANLRFRDFLDVLDPDIAFHPDSEWENERSQSGNRTSSTEQYVTIYEIQYTEFEERFFAAEGEDYIPIEKEEFDTLSQNPKTKDKVFKQQDDTHYVMWYNHGVGVFYNSENEFETWTLLPFQNIKSESRLYPFGSTHYDKHLQDLLNVLVTVAVDNMKRGNKGVHHVDPQSYALYADQITAAVNGLNSVIPANTHNVSYPKDNSAAIVLFSQMVEKAIEEVQSQHSLSKGEMPKERLAKETVNLIMSQDRKSHGRKDVMIRWTLTQVVKLIVRIMQTKFTEQHYATVNDTRRTDPEYIPINMVLNEKEYFQFILERMGVEVQGNETPEEMQQFMQLYVQEQKKFEHDNEVKIKTERIWTLGGDMNRKYNQDEIDALVRQSGATEAEWVSQYGAMYEPIPVYIINDITRNVDLHLIYELDFNADRDRQYRESRAFLLFDRGVYTPQRLLRDLDISDADSVAAEADQRNQALQLGEQIVQNPPLLDLVQKAMAAIQQQGAAKPTGKNGKSEKKPASKEA